MNEKLKVNIYKALPLLLEKVKCVALGAQIGKPSSWIAHKMTNYVVNGNEKKFFPEDIVLMNKGLEDLGYEIVTHLVEYGEDREYVIEQVKELAKYVTMSYVYIEVLKKDKTWYCRRLAQKKPGMRVTSFSEDDILRINMAAMQIANELRSVELTL